MREGLKHELFSVVIKLSHVSVTLGVSLCLGLSAGQVMMDLIFCCLPRELPGDYAAVNVLSFTSAFITGDKSMSDPLHTPP